MTMHREHSQHKRSEKACLAFLDFSIIYIRGRAGETKGVVHVVTSFSNISIQVWKLHIHDIRSYNVKDALNEISISLYLCVTITNNNKEKDRYLHH